MKPPTAQEVAEAISDTEQCLEQGVPVGDDNALILAVALRSALSKIKDLEAKLAEKDMEIKSMRLEDERKLDEWTSAYREKLDEIKAVEAKLVEAGDLIKAHDAAVKAEAFKEVGRRYSELLQISTPADHIRTDDARERELSIYRSESKHWYEKARAAAQEKP